MNEWQNRLLLFINIIGVKLNNYCNHFCDDPIIKECRISQFGAKTARTVSAWTAAVGR